jgi:hypothetical protein
MYDGRNGMTCGPVTRARYGIPNLTGWQAALSGRRLRPDRNHPWGGLQDKRTVRITSAADTARRGDIEPGVDVSSKDSVNSFGARDTLKVGDKS